VAAVGRILTEMRGISTDTQGREILVGLTHDESQEYVVYLNARLANRQTSIEAGDRYVELNNKYESARLAVLGAEIAAREHTSQRH
jgi:hypothetical protein